MRQERSHVLRPLIRGGMALLIGFTALCSGRPTYGDSPVLVQRAALIAGDPAEIGIFGWSVAISGDTAVGGAPNSYVGPGAAYVFVKSATGWSQQQKLTPDTPQAAPTDFGWSVAISDDTIVVGSPFDSGGGFPATGAAYVFVRSGTTWTQQQKLTASDAMPTNNFFGWSVVISGDTIVVGASGAAYVFVRNGSSWSERQKLIPDDGGASFFGFSVALDSDTIAVGNPALGFSSVYVFGRSGSDWSQIQKLRASDVAAATNFGFSVALAGERLVIGAPFDDSAGYSAGSVYVFVKSGSHWSQEEKLLPADPVPPGDIFGKEFGGSVAIGGGIVLTGARNDSMGKGAAYVFGRSGTSWNQLQKLTIADSAAGSVGLSVAISGEEAAIGSGYAAPSHGAVYIFGPPSHLPPVADAGPDQTVECTSPAGAQVQLDGTRSADPDGDFLSYLWTGPFGQASGASPIVQSPLGGGTATLTVENGSGATGTDTVQILVQDTNAPTLSALAANPYLLWPPNHKMVPVNLAVAVFDRCDAAPSCAIEAVTSNEPIAGDFLITSPLQLDLRAERRESGSGRTYAIVVACQDLSGNRSTATVAVVVPHDLGSH
jgi:FG-GAP repeat